MYQFLSLIGPGAMSFLIIQFFMSEKNISFIEGIAQIISLSLINNLAAWLILMPFSKTVLVFNENGTSYVQYGPVELVLLMVITVIVSIGIVIIKKHVTIDIKVEETNE